MDDFAITFEAADGAGESSDGALIFVNSTSTACSVSGQPSLFFGSDAVEGRIPGGAMNDLVGRKPFPVPPGDTVAASVWFGDPEDIEGCVSGTSTYLLVGLTFEDRDARVDMPPVDICLNEDPHVLTQLGVGAVAPVDPN